MSNEGHHPTNAECHAFANEVCRGNTEARVFVDLFYKLCHALDDLIDCKEDGRPTMSNEKIIELWAITALMYNTPYYIKNRTHLFPSILSVTNLYAQSVAWERSPINRQRIMADILRTVGDHVLFIVALLEGGWSNMRTVTAKIMDADWVLQHRDDDTPN